MNVNDGSIFGGDMTTGNPEEQKVQKIEAPFFYASMFQTIWAGNDFTIICGRQHPGLFGNTEEPQTMISGVDVQAIIAMSPQSVKDLTILLNEAVSNYEKEFGTIVTPFTKERSQPK
ncbi:hypothetical protein [Brucella lupini]|nr:hypothetical protein [Brucella lupini]KAB2701348.1 hypothetical protein F9L03_24200 [Brucella lupini]